MTMVASVKNMYRANKMIRITGQVYDNKEREALLRCFDEEDGTAGRFPREFERELAAVTGRRFAILCNSGSSANLLAVVALTPKWYMQLVYKKINDELTDEDLAPYGGVFPKREVITCAAGFPTTVNPIPETMQIPVFVDCDDRMNISVKELDNALSTSTVGIIAANTLGLPMDLEEIESFCKRNGLWFVNDCCDALGGYHNGEPVTKYGDVATLSFYPAHQISTGEGGAVLTDDPKLARRIRSLRDWGRACWCEPGHDNTCGKRFAGEYDHKYTYSEIGYNLNMSKYQAALGLAQLRKLPEFVKIRARNYYHARAGMGDLPVEFPGYVKKGISPSYFGLSMICQDKSTRDALVQHLEANGIMTRPVFGGNLTRQPAYKGIGYIIGTLPNANRVMDCALWVGVWPGLGLADMEYIAQTVRSFF